MQGMRFVLIATLLVLVSCTHPPTQEMANARSAIQTARSLPGDQPQAAQALHDAELKLDQASQAIRDKDFALAREKALEAKHSARQAAKIKQQDTNRQ